MDIPVKTLRFIKKDSNSNTNDDFIVIHFANEDDLITFIHDNESEVDIFSITDNVMPEKRAVNHYVSLSEIMKDTLSDECPTMEEIETQIKSSILDSENIILYIYDSKAKHIHCSFCSGDSYGTVIVFEGFINKKNGYLFSLSNMSSYYKYVSSKEQLYLNITDIPFLAKLAPFLDCNALDKMIKISMRNSDADFVDLLQKIRLAKCF